MSSKRSTRLSRSKGSPRVAPPAAAPVMAAPAMAAPTMAAPMFATPVMASAVPPSRAPKKVPAPALPQVLVTDDEDEEEEVVSSPMPPSPAPAKVPAPAVPQVLVSEDEDEDAIIASPMPPSPAPVKLPAPVVLQAPVTDDEDEEAAMATPVPPSPAPENAPAPAPAVPQAPVTNDEAARFDVAQHAYGAAKDLWSWGRSVPVVTHLLGLTEALAATALDVTLHMDLPSLDAQVTSPRDKKLDDEVVTPLLLAAWKLMEPAVAKGDEVLRPVWQEVVPCALGLFSARKEEAERTEAEERQALIDASPNPDLIPALN